MLLLKATETNWGEAGPGDWEKTKWKIEDDGWYKVTTSYRSRGAGIEDIPDITSEGCMSHDNLNALKSALEEDWSDQQTKACDGTAWEFKYYVNGQVVKHRATGYIYGIEFYERIAALLPRELINSVEF